ncbi:MAG TPA: hypothetical protein VK752_31770 [Bryobacteraceae bacterium]|nr:hypothetical protein [Bryobacteraceae bacterium]
MPALRAGVQPAIASSDSDSQTAIELELISILNGPAFRSSPRSCAFLRFITEESLDGREESLKERTIGVALLKRDPDYDTGSDAVVRVRANDVRKRLSSHYERCPAKAGFRIELPAGSYIPRFVKEPVAEATLLPNGLQNELKTRSFVLPAMPLVQLSAPTIAALFVALIAIRIQADMGAGADAFTRFWSGLLMDRTQILVQLDAAADGVSISPAMAEAAMPISRVASSFQLPFHISAAHGQAVGSAACVIRLSTREHPPLGAHEGRTERVGDALLVYTGGGRTELWVTGETVGSLARAVQTLATRDGFPEIR